ncbi:hypothetical protein KM043_005980 [Ampulex compressa]|nr:hypothetical protein KM043_005980 [Ampulex compressa]
MSKQRRRAANFTDSLYSFRLAISQESLEDANSNDTKENETWKEKNNIASQNSGCSELHSVILAGNTVLASNNYESLAPISPLSSTKDQSLPDLNKCIDLFHNERNDEQQYSDKREIPYGKFDNCESKKDEENIGPAASELFPLSKLSMNKEEYNQNQGQFETILCSLDNRVNQLKEATLSEQTLRRLSKHFLKCPRNFTEKLIRVTEESVLNASNDIHDRSSLNLSRLTAEFKKMCKYINDESSPEWCTSLTISPAIEKTANDTNLMDAKSSEKRMNKSVPSPSIRCSLATPRLYALRKGTDTQLIKNVRAKTDEMLLTPVKIASKTPNTKSPCSVSSRSISKSQEKPPLKVKLSPKLFSTPKSHTSKVLQSNEITSNRENTPNNCFLLPKVYYTSPCQVRKIKDNTPENVGSRIKSLIGPTQSKVVIQHRGKANSARIQKGIKDDNSINEIYYNPEDESLHIEQTATRTNFMRSQRLDTAATDRIARCRTQVVRNAKINARTANAEIAASAAIPRAETNADARLEDNAPVSRVAAKRG